ncbi:MAG: hypothetical protein Q4F21_04790 [Lachnospiraceae bacterium]|nr:hypothetical protein [Lachnospiraceae bacterium]
MKQIYNFECKSPPVLNEKMLLAKLEQKKLQRQTFLLAVGAVLLNICLFIAAFCLLFLEPALALIVFAYACISIAGSGIITIVFVQRKEAF